MGYAGIKGVELAAQMLQTGDAVNRASAAFTALTGNMGGAAANIAALRQATGGIISDYDLQLGSNKLLQMGLVTTTDEMANLAGMAVKLGSAVGKDATSAMADFAQMLANNSILRLDNFGISSANVRAEMEKLKQAGYDTSEAFKMATIEEGRKSLERLGDAANAAQTPINQAATAVQNLVNKFQSDFSTGANALVGILQYMAGTTPQQQAMQSHALDNISPIYQNMIQSFTGGANSDFMLQFVRQSLQDAAKDPSLLDDAHALRRRVIDELTSQGIVGGDTFTNALIGQFKDMDLTEVFNQMAAGVSQYAGTLNYAAQAADNLAAQTRAGSGLLGGMQGGISGGLSGIPGMLGGGGGSGSGYAMQAAALADMRLQAARRQGQAEAAVYNEAYWSEFATGYETNQQRAARDRAIARGQANQLYGSYMMTGGNVQGVGANGFARPEDAAALRSTFDDMTSQFQQMQEMNRAGLISDADLEKASTLKDKVSDLADQADRAAKAFENMKLTDVFGQTGGGMQGQIGDTVIAQMRKNGATPDQIAAAQKQFGLASGQETQSSLAFQSYMPALANLAQVDPAAATKATQTLTTFFQQATVNGLSQDQIVQGMNAILGVQEGGQKITVKPGDTVSSLAAQYGMTPQQIMAATGTTNPRLLQPGQYGAGTSITPNLNIDPMQLLTNILLGGQGTGPNTGKTPTTGFMGGMLGGTGKETDNLNTMVDTFDKVSVSSDSLRENMEGIADKVTTANTAVGEMVSSMNKIKNVTSTITLTADDPMGLIPILTMLAGGTSLETMIQSNGGNVPGTPASNTNTGGRSKGFKPNK